MPAPAPRRRARARRRMRTCASATSCAAASDAPRRRCSAACGARHGVGRRLSKPTQHARACHACAAIRLPGACKATWQGRSTHLNNLPLLALLLGGLYVADAAMLLHCHLLDLQHAACGMRHARQAPVSAAGGRQNPQAPFPHNAHAMRAACASGGPRMLPHLAVQVHAHGRPRPVLRVGLFQVAQLPQVSVCEQVLRLQHGRGEC